MLPKETVFVVGAGGSVEFGLPVGDELKARIAAALNFQLHGGIVTGGARTILDVLRQPEYANEHRQYIAAAIDLAAAMPLAPSIDNYLHTHSKDKYAVTVGKLAIAHCILDAERNTALVHERHQQLDFQPIKPSWHADLAKILFEGLDRDDLANLFDNLSIITFNYDRCIEQYFAAAIQRYFKVGFQEAEEACSKLRIFHVYGQVGRLPWQPGSGAEVTFGEEPNMYYVHETAKQIRTFTEREEDETRLKAMHQLLIDAELVVYLGFSFGRINMELLTTKGGAVDKEVLGTAFGVSEANVKHITEAVHQSLEGATNTVQRIELPSLKCHDFMQHYLWDIAYSDPMLVSDP